MKISLGTIIGLAACMTAIPALNASTTINLTGCLAHGPAAHEYTATDGNGQRFGLVADTQTDINLKKHVGQEVMITGYVIKGNRERRQDEKAGAPPDSQYLRVEQLKKVSESCQ